MTKSITSCCRDIEKKSLIGLLGKIDQDYVRKGSPISLTIRTPGIGEVVCIRVFRAIQGKRLVCLGETGGRKVIVKLYFSPRRARANWKRSHSGCRAFIERHIPAPGILFSGHVPEYGLYAMVFKYLVDAVRVDSALETCPDMHVKGQVLDLLVNCLADIHEHGILQNDLHMGNFMIRGECIYALDGDQVKTSRWPIKRIKSLKNLARLLANLPTGYNSILEARILSYVNRRGWHITDAEVKKVKDDVRKIRWGFLSEYLSKINRTRDPFISYTDTRTFSVFDRHHIDLEHEAILKASAYPYPENENSDVSGYSKISVDSKDILIWKSPGYGPLILKRFWPASRVWKNALMLRWLSIRTPHPIAIVMRKGGAFRWDCFVFFKPVEGIRFGDLFFSKTVSGEDKELVAACLADTLSVMNGMGI